MVYMSHISSLKKTPTSTYCSLVLESHFFVGPFLSEKGRSSVSTWSSPIFRQHAEDGYSGGCVEDSPHRVGTRCDVHGGGTPPKIIREQNKMLSQKVKTRLPKFKEKMFVCNFGMREFRKVQHPNKTSHEFFGGHWTSRLACLEVVG